jgi:hypothetical protein
VMIGASALVLFKSASRSGLRQVRPRRRKTLPLDQE